MQCKNIFDKNVDTSLLTDNATRNFYLQKSAIIDNLNQKQEREKFKQEVIDEVMQRIYMTFDLRAVDELIKLLNNVFK